jgi:hypothetical protein
VAWAHLLHDIIMDSSKSNSVKKRYCTHALAQLVIGLGRPQLVEIWFKGMATVFHLHTFTLLALVNHNIAEDIRTLSNDSNIITQVGMKDNSAH